MFQKFDKSGRVPRDVQVQALKWLSENWHKAEVFGIRADTGSGKSAMGRAILEPKGGHYITPSNMLLDQVSCTYPGLPAVKGYQNYTCQDVPELDCMAAKMISGKFCKGCPAAKVRKRAFEEPISIYNPISYHAIKRNHKFSEPSVLVVDEAHALPRMALLFADVKFICKDYLMPRLKSAVDIKDWADKRLVELRKVGESHFAAGRYKDADKVANKVRKLHKITDLFHSGQNYIWEYKSEPWRGKHELMFYMRPVDPPRELMDKLLQANKIVLMSATLFKSDVERLAVGRKYLYLDLPSPIPKEQRAVVYNPMQTANSQTEPAAVAKWIQEQLALHKGNAIIHVTYGWAAKLRPFDFYTVANFEPDQKIKAIDKFRKEGGVFLAAGCAEGLDLPYDQCRVNLIPILYKENIGDSIVKKRLLRPNGRREYDIETIRTTIQQTGRSTRSDDDHSVTVIGDPAFFVLMQRYRDVVPSSYRESIKW